MPSGKRSAGITSGTLAVSAQDGVLLRNIRELVSAAGGLLRPEYDTVLRVIEGQWRGWPRIRDDRRSPDGERELERRRLERECQCRDEPERVERREPGLLPKLSYGLPLSRGRLAFYAVDPAAELPPHLIELFRKKDILLVVERSHVQRICKKNFATSSRTFAFWR